MPRVHVRAKPDRKTLQLYYVDPLTGRDVTRSAKTTDWKEAERAAANWEREVEAGDTSRPISWEQFRLRFESEYLPQCAAATGVAISSAMNHFERILGKPKELAAIDSQTVNRFSSRLRTEGMTAATIGKQLRHLRLVLNWAAKVGYIKTAPRFLMPRDAGTSAKGRPITDAEFLLMLNAANEPYKRLIEGLWLSGLRLEEALRLSWDAPPVMIDTHTGTHPRIVFAPEGHKNRKSVSTPMTPEFAAFLGDSGRGLVFPIGLSVSRVSHEISAIGKAAGIKVSPTKYASAHDLRRSFATRWAMKVPPLVLKTLMRHSSINTTLSFYVNADIDDISGVIWGHFVPPPVPAGDGNAGQASQKTP